MGSIYQTTLNAVAADRKMSPDKVKSAVEAGPYTAEEAQAKGLVDKIGQAHDAENTALAAAGPGAKLVDMDDYKASLRGQPDGAPGDPVIAVVQAEGPIQTGVGSNDLFGTTANI
jgi:protease-4